MKNDKIFLLIRLTIATKYSRISDTIKELENNSSLSMSSTKNVKVLKTEILKTRQ